MLNLTGCYLYFQNDKGDVYQRLEPQGLLAPIYEVRELDPRDGIPVVQKLLKGFIAKPPEAWDDEATPVILLPETAHAVVRRNVYVPGESFQIKDVLYLSRLEKWS